MSVKYLKFLALLCAMGSPVAGGIAPCNVPLLNSFHLTGFETAVHDPMKVCPFVQDKCCTVADEVRITKFWKERSEPIINARYAAVIEQISRIVDSFWPMMSIDIELLVLKKVTKRIIPYKYTTCLPEFRRMNETEVEAFANKQDIDLEGYYRLKHSVLDPTNSTAFNKTNYTMDELGNRSWNVPLTQEQLYRERRFQSFVRKFLPPTTITTFEMKCSEHEREVEREMVIVNEPKTKFCLGLYEKFLSFDIVQFKYTLKVVKAHLNSFGQYKKTFYCFLCDAFQQRFVDVDKQVIVFSEPFCRNLLKEKTDYIRFMHIIFIEYADSMLQYIHCYETDGSPLTLPFQNFLIRFKRRIPLVKKCLDSIDKGDFMNNCWFICNKFSITKFSNFWEGDLEMLDRIVLAIKSFLRKLKIEFDEDKLFEDYKQKAGGRPVLTTTGNVDGLILEPMSELLNPSHILTDQKFYLRAEDRFQMFNRTNTTRLVAGDVASNVDDFLKSIGLPTLEQTRIQKKQQEELQKQLEKAQKTRNMTPEEKRAMQNQANPDYSQVNGLMNKLNIFLPKEYLSPGMYPERRAQLIRDEIIEKSTKLDPRKLDMVFLTNRLSKMVAKAPKITEKANITMPVEEISQIFNKIEPTVDVSMFDSTFGAEGLDPLRFATSVNYNYNVSNLLSEKFEKEEKLSINVLDSFLSITAKSINIFNQDIDLPIVGYEELIAELSFLPKINMLIKFAKRQNSKVLLREGEKLKTKIIRSKAAGLQTAEKLRMMKKMKKLMEQMSAELHEVKMQRMRNTTLDHIDKKHFKENFNGFAGFFTSLFGN